MMLRENRKKGVSACAFPFHTLSLLAAGAALALGYVWLDAKGEMLGDRIMQLERDAAEVQRRYEHELWKWECAISPSNIEETLNRNHIVMVWPEEDNIVRLRRAGISLAELRNLPGETTLFALSQRQLTHD